MTDSNLGAAIISAFVAGFISYCMQRRWERKATAQSFQLLKEFHQGFGKPQSVTQLNYSHETLKGLLPTILGQADVEVSRVAIAYVMHFQKMVALASRHKDFQEEHKSLDLLIASCRILI